MDELSYKKKRWLGPLVDLRSLTSAEEIVATLATHRTLSFDAKTEAWTFPDVEKAEERIRRAAANGEVVGVFGDYDCDGVTGAALLLRLLRSLNVRPVVRLPHRAKEGYGLKQLHVEEMLRKQVTLLITVDTGIGCAKEIAYAQDHGCDVIVLDHHHVPPEPAKPYAVLHPALVKNWPGAHPAAAGVAWALVHAMRTGATPQERDEDLILATWGTIADLVPLRDGNRALVQSGLLACARVQSGPIAALLQQAEIEGVPSARDIAFRIAPRINAAGRMADPMIALKAVMGDTPSLQSLEQLNSQRQATVQEYWEQAWSTMNTDAPFLFLKSDEYTPGIVGLLAGKLTEMFGKPSLVASVRNGECTASLRSVSGYDVTAALQRNAHLLTTFGGHAQAAGCTFPQVNSDALEQALCEDVSARMSAQELLPTMQIDAVMTPEQLTMELLVALRALEPHGQGNDAPRFLFANVVPEDARLVGQDRSHLHARLGDVKLIGFGLGEVMEHVMQGCDIVGTVAVHEWQGKTSVQVMIEDVRLTKSKKVSTEK